MPIFQLISNFLFLYLYLFMTINSTAFYICISIFNYLISLKDIIRKTARLQANKEISNSKETFEGIEELNLEI